MGFKATFSHVVYIINQNKKIEYPDATLKV